MEFTGGGTLESPELVGGGVAPLIGAVVGGAPNNNGFPGSCCEALGAGNGFFGAEIERESELIPGGRISIGGFLSVSPKLGSFGSSREARNAAVASVLVVRVCSISFCNVLFHASTKFLRVGRPWA